MGAYLDNCATTRVRPEVVRLMVRVMEEDYGNPSSMHRRGVEAEKIVKTAASQIAATLKADPGQIVFSSGGTESNNLAVLGAAQARRRSGMHIITSGIEHASVYQSVRALEKQGFEVTYLPTDRYGVISLEALEDAVRPDTILLSLMHVNNEIGSVQPVEEAGRILRRKSPDALFHVDAIQGYGKYLYRPKKQGIDLLSVSGHKLHGPKGTGFLYLSDRARVLPQIYGGGQQHALRSGTENVPGIAGMGLAAKLLYEEREEKVAEYRALRSRFIGALKALPDVFVNGYEDDRNAPQIVSASFAGVRAEVLLHALEDREIYVSAGSACSSNHPEKSRTLTGIGLPDELVTGTLRFSFGIYTTREEIDETAAVLGEVLPVLRRFKRG